MVTQASTKASRSRSRTARPKAVLFRYRDADSVVGVSRGTAGKLAQKLGLNETQVLHYAMAQLARSELPQYEPDDGPLSKGDVDAIRKLEPQGRMRIRQSLF